MAACSAKEDSVHFTEFQSQILHLLAEEPAAKSSVPTDRFYPFTFVSQTVRPAFRRALDGDEELLVRLALVIENMLAEAEDETEEAIAMRLIEPLLCRDPDALARTRRFLGPVTMATVEKFQRVINDAERATAELHPALPPTVLPES